ncbi:hypothetical protein HMPREF9709_00224 [Helcococcus kunzii ATCC 51366]|uniref:YolD-like protein n=1 Tax=Helcococcus kunzii ATCC 51366 TaxID=883114 RepID=H3NLL3_9FIRM|nr:hypothetical protein [Helcococcus kunzii]EHR35778.1 hypothetical protein HMPREF9709_00224 [Helcococcus kunzii ATCC 51366]
MKNDIHDYNKIIDMPRPKFNTYKKMSRHDRAAQFAPFAALNGHQAAVDEKARQTEKRIILDEDQKEILNHKFTTILEKIDEKPLIKVVYFEKDTKKLGGKYLEKTNWIKKIDEINRKIIFIDRQEILIDNIYDIEIQQ